MHFFFSSRRRHTRSTRDWSSDVCSSDLLEVPTEGDAAQIGIHEDSTIAVVPRHTQQSGLPGTITLQSKTQGCNIRGRATGDGIKDVADCRQTGLDASSPWMHTSLHNPADSWNKIYGRRDANDAGGCADYVDDVICATACSNGIPMRIECSYWNGNSSFKAQHAGPIRRESAGDLIGGAVLASQFFPNAREQRINLRQKSLRRQAAERRVP